MIKYTGRTANIITIAYYDARCEMPITEWLKDQSVSEIEKVAGFTYRLHFERPEDELFFRIKFGI